MECSLTDELVQTLSVASLSDDEIQKYSLRFEPTEEFTGQEPELEPRCEVYGFDFMEGM